MPTYLYLCNNKECNHEFETEQSIKAEPLTQCPECLQESIKRLICSGNFILNGTGWFKSGGY